MRELRLKLKNKKIKQVRVLLGKIIGLGPQTLSPRRTYSPAVTKKFTAILQGQKISRVLRRAKMIIIDLSGPWALLVHLKMTGQLVFLKRQELDKKIKLLNTENFKPVSLPCKWTHVIFDFVDGSKLFFNDLRQFGYMRLVKDSEIEQVKELKKFGPEPFSKEFTYPTFKNILARRPSAKLKQLLVDQNLIAGIGNIYSDEILFFARLRPSRMPKSLSEKDKQRLFRGILKILKIATEKHGSSVGDYVRSSGDWGSFGLYHKVYGRAGKPCKVCGSMIKSLKFNGRTGSFCPQCQK